MIRTWSSVNQQCSMQQFMPQHEKGKVDLRITGLVINYVCLIKDLAKPFCV